MLAAAAVCTCLIPYTPHVLVLTLLTSVQGAAMGLLDSVANTLIVYAHGEKVGPWMQTMHFTFGIGAILSPLFIRISMAISEKYSI